MQSISKLSEPKELLYSNRVQMKDVTREMSGKHKKLKFQRMPVPLQPGELDLHYLPTNNIIFLYITFRN